MSSTSKHRQKQSVLERRGELENTTEIGASAQRKTWAERELELTEQQRQAHRLARAENEARRAEHAQKHKAEKAEKKRDDKGKRDDKKG